MRHRNDLYMVAPIVRPVIAEVGVDGGYYTDVYYPRLIEPQVYLVDLWQTEGNDAYFSQHPELVEQGYRRVLDRYGSCPNVHLCKGLSTEWASRFPDRFFDWVYIDADHSYEAVRRDIVAWLPKVKIGGVLSGHDFNGPANDPAFGVNQAVIEIFGHRFGLTGEPSYQSWYIEVKG